METIKEERYFVIERGGCQVTITIRENKMMKIVVIKKSELYSIHRNGYWDYYDNENQITIRPKANGQFSIKGGSNDRMKMYIKALEVENECENIWREALNLVRHAYII